MGQIWTTLGHCLGINADGKHNHCLPFVYRVMAESSVHTSVNSPYLTTAGTTNMGHTHNHNQTSTLIPLSPITFTPSFQARHPFPGCRSHGALRGSEWHNGHQPITVFPALFDIRVHPSSIYPVVCFFGSLEASA